MRRRALLMGGKVIPNTIIGGVGSVITTKSALATKLGISESIIRGFEVVGNDVHCKITSNYTIPTQCFDYNTQIKSYLDLDGKVSLIGTNAFRYSTIQTGHFPAVTEIGHFSFSAISSIYAPNATSITNNGFEDTYFLTSLTTGVLTSVGAYGIENSIATPDLSNVTSLGNYALDYTKYTTLNLPLITSISVRSWGYLTLCTHAYFPNLTTITNSNTAFANWTSAELISMKKLKTFGSPVYSNVNNTGFGGLKMGCKIEVNVFMATADSGAPHQAFLYAKNTRGAIVEFYDDDGNYVSTL